MEPSKSLQVSFLFQSKRVYLVFGLQRIEETKDGCFSKSTSKFCYFSSFKIVSKIKECLFYIKTVPNNNIKMIQKKKIKMKMHLKDFTLEDLFRFQKKIPQLKPHQENKLAEKENSFLKQFLKKENIDQKLEKKEKKQLLETIYNKICEKIEEEKESIKGDFYFPLDLRNQSKRNLRKLSETLKKNNYLEEIRLGVDGISMQFLFDAIKCNKSLKVLRIENIDDDVGAHYLSKALESNDTLEELFFTNLKITKNSSKFLFNFLKKNRSIKKIRFDNILFEESGNKHFLKNMIKNTTLKMIFFNSFRNLNYYKNFAKFVKNNQQLEYLLFSQCKINPGDMLSLSKSFENHQSLKEIQFRHNHLESQSILYLSESLKHNNSLQKLRIVRNKFENLGMVYFSDYLKQNSTLQVLDVSENEINSDLAKCLFTSLNSNKSLKELNISYNNIGYDGIKHLENINFETFGIFENKIGEKGFENLCDILKPNQSLKKLFFTRNFYETKSISLQLVDLLKTNNSICKIDEKNGGLMAKYFLNCNKEWKKEIHHKFSKSFKNSVFSFVCCLKKIEQNLPFKMGKFVVFEIIKKVERKSFQQLDFPEHPIPVIEKENQHDNKKRKREEN